MGAPEDQQEDLEALKKHVLVHVGVSLARYQKIERGLKALLPFLVVEGRPVAHDPFAEMRELLASKSTLGPLMERLKASVSTPDPEDLADYLETVVGHRNELVHQFFQLPVGRLDEAEACHAAIRHLTNRLDYAQPLLDLVNAAAAAFIESAESTRGPSH